MAHLQWEREILGDGEMRKQSVVLEHDTNVATLGRDAVGQLTVDADRTRRGFDETRNEMQNGRFAGAGRSEEGEESARRYGQREVIDCANSPVVLGD